MRITTFSSVVGLFNAVFLVGLALISIHLLQLQRETTEANQRLLQSHKLAEELRQSSDDLTRMARAYVNTGESIFKDYYYAILGIRNGTEPRPKNYSTTYWTFALGRADSSFLHTDGERIPLLELMRRAGFRQEEFALLRASQAESDSLVKTERKAFAAMEGLFDDGRGTFTIHRHPDKEYARRLMYDVDYRTAKIRIMEPINRFMQAVDARTSGEQVELSRRRSLWLQVALGICLMLLAGFVGSAITIRRLVLIPMKKLGRQVGFIAKGDYSARNDIHTSNEFRTLGESFNAMVARVGEWHTELETKVRERTQQLSENEELFRAAFKTGSDAYVLAGRDDGRMVEVNDEFERMYGYQRNELIGKTSLELGLWPHPEQRQMLLDELAAKGQVRNLEILAREKGGKEFPVLYSVSQLHAGGRPLILGVVRNIALQRAMEESLHASDIRLRNLSDNIPGGLVYQLETDSMGQQRKFVYISAGVVRLHEVSPEAVIHDAQVLYRQMDEHDRSRVAALETEALSGMSVFRCEVCFHLPSGIARWSLLNSAPRRGHEGRIIWDGVEIDISERKLAEQALKASELRLKEAQQIAHVGSSEWNTATDTTTWSDEMFRITGWDPNMPLPSMAERKMLYTPESYEELSRAVQRALEGGEPYDLELEVVRRDGTRLQTEARGAAVKNEHGKIVGLQGTLQDISERRRAEEKIKEREVQYRELVETARDEIYTLSADGTFTSVNAAFESVTGWTREEWKGKPFVDLLHRKDVAKMNERFTRSMHGEPQPLDEIHIKTKSGKYVLVELSTVPQTRHGKVVGVLGIGRDITERKQLEEQLRRTQRLDSIGSLASGIAHDLNNVLGPILLGVDVLSRKIADESSKKILENLRNSSKRGSDIVKQVLAFARGTEQEYSPQQLRYLVNEIHSFVRATFPRDIDIRIDIPKDLPPVLGDSTQLHQILLNLCVNARDAMPSGGHIGIAASKVILSKSDLENYPGVMSGAFVCLSVSDSGTGIPEDIRVKIFDPFFTTKEVGKGTGLGLSTVNSIVRDHKGFIKLVSEVGRGTEFKIYLPAIDQEQPAAKAEEQELLPRGNGEGVLVVDDEQSIVQIARETLEAYNYRVYTATDGVEATLVFNRENRGSIALVVSDINMPRMNGVDLAQILKNSDPHVKILMTSGSPAETAAKRAELVKYEFLSKPFTANELLCAIDKLLHQTNNDDQTA